MTDVDTSHAGTVPHTATTAAADGWGFEDRQEVDEERERLAERGDATGEDHADLGSFVDQTPLCVSEKLPLEIVMQLFRRMG
jgi:hypothetical protein